jgi:hypothetical protein
VTRDDLLPVASAALIGAVVTLMAVLVWTEISRPAPFPTTAAANPTPFVVPTPTPRGKVPLTLTTKGLGLVSFGEAGGPVVDRLHALLGSPTSDDRWTCKRPVADVRFVGWAELGVFVIDGVFVGYVDAIYYPPEFGPLLGLATTEGIGIGLDLKDLQTQLGKRLKLLQPGAGVDANHRKFVIDGEPGIWGVIEKGPGGSRVITIAAGTTCFDDHP